MHKRANNCKNGVELNINAFEQNFLITTTVHTSLLNNSSQSGKKFVLVLNSMTAKVYQSEIGEMIRLLSQSQFSTSCFETMTNLNADCMRNEVDKEILFL